jgi:hypothetical protein
LVLACRALPNTTGNGSSGSEGKSPEDHPKKEVEATPNASERSFTALTGKSSVNGKPITDFKHGEPRANKKRNKLTFHRYHRHACCMGSSRRNLPQHM